MKKLLMTHSSSDLYGSGKIFLKTALHLKEQGYQPYVVLSSDGPMVTVLKEAGIEVYFIRLGILRRKYFSIPGVINRAVVMLQAGIKMARLVKQKEVDLLFTQSSGAIVCALVQFLTRKPHVWHVLEITLKPVFLVKFTAFLLSKYSDTVMVASKEVANHWAKYAPNANIQVIYNGVDGATLNSSIELKRTEQKENLHIGMIGRVHFWKGQDYFLDIAAELLKKNKHLTFYMAGDAFPGYEYLYDDIKQQKDRLGINEHVVDLGFVDDPRKFFDQIDIFVLPSIQPDPFPTTLLEAMVLEKPVVGTNHGGAREMILDEETGYLIPWDDAKQAASKIQHLIDSEALRKQFGSAGSSRVKTLFTEENYNKGVVGLVEELIG
ncbi:MAG: glycosyltransferase family 4 protein [Cytophagales bacterium]|nr:glycosyltransferase family 4 protein [Cytophagales bacterium]